MLVCRMLTMRWVFGLVSSLIPSFFFECEVCLHAGVDVWIGTSPQGQVESVVC